MGVGISCSVSIPGGGYLWYQVPSRVVGIKGVGWVSSVGYQGGYPESGYQGWVSREWVSGVRYSPTRGGYVQGGGYSSPRWPCLGDGYSPTKYTGHGILQDIVDKWVVRIPLKCCLGFWKHSPLYWQYIWQWLESEHPFIVYFYSGNRSGNCTCDFEDNWLFLFGTYSSN